MRREEAADVFDEDVATVGLAVDDGDAAWSDGEVIDVRLAVAGDAAVVRLADVAALEVLGEAGVRADLA